MTNLKVDNFETTNFSSQNFESETLKVTNLSGDAIYDSGKRVLTEHQSLDTYATKSELAQMELKPATSTRLGGVKINGNNLKILSDGTLSASAGGGSGGDVPHEVKSYEVLSTFNMSSVNWTQTTGTIAILAMPWEQGDIKISAEMGYEFIFNNERTSDGICHIGNTYGWYMFHRLPNFQCYLVQQIATGGW